MEKIKFMVQGMHCKACATLIEERLKERPGVIGVKVGADSNKAVVMFNPQKIKKTEIFQTVKSAGDYFPEEIKDGMEGKTIEEQGATEAAPTGHNEIESRQGTPSAKTLFFIGLLTAFSIISLGFNIFLGTAYLKSSSSNNSQAIQKNDEQIAKTSPQNQPTQKAAAPAVKQSFQITKDDHVRGDFNAPITLVEFSDFECPFCGRHYPTLNKILDDYEGQVRLVYKQFPLTNIHPNAQKAAEASECAWEQGKFWEYHDKLFDNQAGGYSIDKFKTWATDLNLDSDQFNSCLDSGKYASKISADQQEGNTKGVQGTPATFVNGQLVSGALPYENFKQIIDSLLAT